ncbi:MAG: carboxypeptidase regulatory-like protein [Paenibacillus sp.]|jgi:hypothetical protein|nr:carboxypeptidase regulatory-like protein [Paenibacillus sp.]
MIRKIKPALFVLLMVITAFWTDSRSGANAQTNDPQARIELEQTTFVVKTWRSDGSHLTAVKGRLTFGERPVANAQLQADANGRNIQTGEDGSFELLVDRSLITQKLVRVSSLSGAQVDGKPIGKEEVNPILAASSAISVYHPIEVTRVEASDSEANMVRVHARFKSEAGDKISFFQAHKYRISGQVRDADGNPVENAIVWIDRDQGEGFAKSTPTDKQGRYEMYYWPEDEDTNLTVIVGERRYTLPEGKVLLLPRNTSVDIGIQLPKEGLVIADKSPALECTTTKGATYSGLLAGLDVPPGTSYSITIPDQYGRFVVKLPKEAWDKHPLFFETQLTKFIGQEKILKAGDELPYDFVQPQHTDPRVDAAAS